VAHARAKLMPIGRKLLVERVLTDGWKPADAAKAMGVSRQTAYKWLRRFRDDGPAGLLDRSSAPRRCPHRLDEGTVAAIIEARLQTLKGPHRLAYELGRPRSTIYGVLRRHWLSRLAYLDRPTRTVVRYERARPGELLHVDVKKLGRIREGVAGSYSVERPSRGTTASTPPLSASTFCTWRSTTTHGWPLCGHCQTRKARLVPPSWPTPPGSSPATA